MAIFLHIGLHKCASSYIQSLFSSNSEKLQSLGIRYPSLLDLHGSYYQESISIKIGGDAGNHSMPLFVAFCEDPEHYHGIKLNSLEYGSYKLKVLDKLGKYISESQRLGLHSFLSGEELTHPSFGKRSPRSMISFLKEYDPEIHIISIIRNPLPLLSSIIQQKVKGGHTFGKCARSYPALYKERLESWFHASAELGAQVHPINLDAIEVDMNRNIEFRVCKIVSSNTFESTFFNTKRIQPNHSLSGTQVMILSKVNKIARQKHLDTLSAYQLRSYALRLINPLFNGPKFAAPSPLVRRFSGDINSDSNWINQYLTNSGNQSQRVEVKTSLLKKSGKDKKKKMQNACSDIASIIVKTWEEPSSMI